MTMSASYGAATSGSTYTSERAERPSRTRTVLSGYPALHEARTLVMLDRASMGHAVHVDEATAHHAGPSSARVRAALDELSLVLPATPSRQAARLAAGLAAVGDRRAARELLRDAGAPGGDRTSRPAPAAEPKESRQRAGARRRKASQGGRASG